VSRKFVAFRDASLVVDWIDSQAMAAVVGIGDDFGEVRHRAEIWQRGLDLVPEFHTPHAQSGTGCADAINGLPES
jgi:hypothetical protein